MIALLWLLGCAHRLGPPAVRPGPDEVALPLVHPSTDAARWYVPVHAGGPWLMFVDTGYSYTTCDDDFVEALGLEPRGRKPVRGELGVLYAAKVRLPDLDIGGHRVRGLVCLVRDLDGTSSIRDPAEVGVAGVLGIDALRPFRVTLDPGRAELRLADPSAAPRLPDGPHVVRLRRERWVGTRAMVPLHVGGRSAWTVLDTGATGTYVDGERLGLEPDRVERGVTVRGSGPGGSIRVDRRYFDVDDAALAGHPLGPLTLTDRDRAHGLLGLDVLDRFAVELDFRARRARFTPVHAAPRPAWEEAAADEGPRIEVRHDGQDAPPRARRPRPGLSRSATTPRRGSR